MREGLDCEVKCLGDKLGDKLEPRSHGGLRLNGDLPGWSVNRWRVLGLVYLPSEEVFIHGWRVES